MGGWSQGAGATFLPASAATPRSPRGHKGELRPRCQPGRGLPVPPRRPAEGREHQRGRGFPSRPQARALGVVDEEGT